MQYMLSNYCQPIVLYFDYILCIYIIIYNRYKPIVSSIVAFKLYVYTINLNNSSLKYTFLQTILTLLFREQFPINTILKTLKSKAMYALKGLRFSFKHS